MVSTHLIRGAEKIQPEFAINYIVIYDLFTG